MYTCIDDTYASRVLITKVLHADEYLTVYLQDTRSTYFGCVQSQTNIFYKLYGIMLIFKDSLYEYKFPRNHNVVKLLIISMSKRYISEALINRHSQLYLYR